MCIVISNLTRAAMDLPYLLGVQMRGRSCVIQGLAGRFGFIYYGHLRGLPAEPAKALADRSVQPAKQAVKLHSTMPSPCHACLMSFKYGPLCLQVRAQVPQQALQQAGEAFMETGHSECTSLKIVLQSDFKEYSLPLHLHSGASWLISDLTQSSKSMLDWLGPWAS